MMKKLTVLIITLLFTQILTFYTLSDALLIEEVGRRHESYCLEYKSNGFTHAGVVSKVKLSKNQVLDSFKSLKPYEISLYNSFAKSKESLESKVYYIYWFDFKTRNPFYINILNEGEFAEAYAASWESKYIWVLCKWILINKSNTGIS